MIPETVVREKGRAHPAALNKAIPPAPTVDGAAMLRQLGRLDQKALQEGEQVVQVRRRPN